MVGFYSDHLNIQLVQVNKIRYVRNRVKKEE